MSALDSLIRLHRWQLDERRRELAELEALAGKLRQERRAARCRGEVASRRSPPPRREAATAYGGYARRLVERRVSASTSRWRRSSEQIAIAREALADAIAK